MTKMINMAVDISTLIFKMIIGQMVDIKNEIPIYSEVGVKYGVAEHRTAKYNNNFCMFCLFIKTAMFWSNH